MFLAMNSGVDKLSPNVVAYIYVPKIRACRRVLRKVYSTLVVFKNRETRRTLIR